MNLFDMAIPFESNRENHLPRDTSHWFFYRVGRKRIVVVVNHCYEFAILVEETPASFHTSHFRYRARAFLLDALHIHFSPLACYIPLTNIVKFEAFRTRQKNLVFSGARGRSSISLGAPLFGELFDGSSRRPAQGRPCASCFQNCAGIQCLDIFNESRTKLTHHLPYLLFKLAKRFRSPSFRSSCISQKMAGMSPTSNGSSVPFLAVMITSLPRPRAKPTS